MRMEPPKPCIKKGCSGEYPRLMLAPDCFTTSFGVSLSQVRERYRKRDDAAPEPVDVAAEAAERMKPKTITPGTGTAPAVTPVVGNAPALVAEGASSLPSISVSLVSETSHPIIRELATAETARAGIAGAPAIEELAAEETAPSDIAYAQIGKKKK